MVTIRVTETYDLKTTKNKLGIVGIHTPAMTLIRRLYPGLCKQYKFIRYKKCDIVGACASVLPADPLQVGVSSGTVAPEDMFNPLLYKAVSNESFDTLVSRIYDSVNTTDVIERTGSVNDQVLDVSTDDAFKIYYSLLSENKGWRKSMPQTGFRIKGLYPLAHTLLANYGNMEKPHDTLTKGSVSGTDYIAPDNLGNVPFATDNLSSVGSALTSNGLVFKGKSVKMPKFPLHYTTEGITDATADAGVPKTFVACMIVPPARLHEFYYRMRVSWTVQFSELTSTLAYGPIGTFGLVGDVAHGSDYTYASAKSELPSQNSMVDADSVDVNKIMES